MKAIDKKLNLVINNYKKAVLAVDMALAADLEYSEIEKLENKEEQAHEAFKNLMLEMTPKSILATLTPQQKKVLVAKMADKYIHA